MQGWVQRPNHGSAQAGCPSTTPRPPGQSVPDVDQTSADTSIAPINKWKASHMALSHAVLPSPTSSQTVEKEGPERFPFASISAMERKKLSKPLRIRIFIRFQLIRFTWQPRTCASERKATTLEKNPKDLFSDRQSALGPQTSVLILPLALPQECSGTRSCLTYAQMSCRCCVQMGNVSLETTYSHILQVCVLVG